MAGGGGNERNLGENQRALVDIYPGSEEWRAKVWGMHPSEQKLLLIHQELAIFEMQQYMDDALAAPPPPIPLPEGVHMNQLSLDI